ncbi:MAG: ribulose-phosphate 3-epimerase [Chloroflexota bacterium]
MIDISASLLAADYARMGEEVVRATKASVDSFHFDMMDGHYVRNLALTPDHLRALRKYTSLPFRVHLELSNPDDVIEMFEAGDAQTINVMLDTLKEPRSIFTRIRSLGAQVGLTLTIEQPVDLVIPYIDEIDELLILGVHPGFGGQVMHPQTLERISFASRMIQDKKLNISIAVDGGINLTNVGRVISQGCTCVIIGSTLFKSADMAGLVQNIRRMNSFS